MRPDLEESLFAIEPGWFNRTDIKVSLMQFGFCVDDGWYPIVESLLKLAKDRGFKPGEFEVKQVKGKIGGLRFHYDGGDAEFAKALLEAERLSMKTCEVCGNPGEVMEVGGRTGRTKCVCPDHARSDTVAT